jgi:TIR domain
VPKIFISYRRDDSSADTHRIRKWLTEQFGKHAVFMDTQGIDPAADFRKGIAIAIEKCDLFIPVIGPQWLNSADKDGRRRLDATGDYVRNEIETALIRDIVILPVLVRGTSMPAPDDLPPSLRDLAFQNGVQIREEPDFDEDMGRLKLAIDKIANGSRHRKVPWLLMCCGLIASFLCGGLAVYLARSTPPNPWVLIPAEDSSPDSARLIHTSNGFEYPIDKGSLSIVNNPTIGELPVPLSLGRRHVGKLKDAFNSIIISHTNIHSSVPYDYPTITSDIIANTFMRLTYLLPTGGSAKEGTSVVASPSFRPPGEDLLYIPTVEKAMVTTGEGDRVRVDLRAHFGSSASVLSVRSYPQPDTKSMTARLVVEFRAEEDIALDSAQLKSDAFRFLTLSSMFNKNNIYDANVLIYQDGKGKLRLLRLDEENRRDRHLNQDGDPEAWELGSWFELVKEPGSNWQPDSPSIRVDINDRSGLDGRGRLAIQGFLAKSTDTNHDTLNVWVEWLDAPKIIQAGTTLKMGFTITATPPRQAIAD